MGSSYFVMEFKMEVWTSKFQLGSTTAGRFMNASIIPDQLIVVAQI